MRKRTLFRLKERHFISVTPIPKVKIRVFYRPDGSWHWSFGHISQEYLISQGLYWDKDGKKIYNGKGSGRCGGQDYCINSMWRWIREWAYRDNIHSLDLA